MKTFISVTEARRSIQQEVSQSSSIHSIPLREANRRVLAEDVYAATDIPAYPQSSMDGYAFKFSDWNLKQELLVQGEVAAGAKEATPLKSHSATRIFTGAAVPPGADTVVMQEKVRRVDDKLFIEDENLRPGANVRPKGGEVVSGAKALEEGCVLTPGAIGFLAGIGVAEIKVYKLPVVTIIVTGNELQQPGKPLEHGQVYESNSLSLRSALLELQLTDVKVEQAPDDLPALVSILQNALDISDVVLITGGVSVGNYDFVVAAANGCGVDPVFHKVKQRPGKPLYFGKKENKLIFGLPGNPSSVLTCFYMYVMPALEKICRRNFKQSSIQAPLAKKFEKSAGLTHFLKAQYNDGEVELMEAQESYRMRSFATANCLVELDEEKTIFERDELVTVHLLTL